MKVDNRTKRLIAIGASISANCQPCLQINVTRALEEGIVHAEIEEAIEVGKLVQQGAAIKMDRFAVSLKPAILQDAAPAISECGCKN